MQYSSTFSSVLKLAPLQCTVKQWRLFTSTTLGVIVVHKHTHKSLNYEYKYSVYSPLSPTPFAYFSLTFHVYHTILTPSFRSIKQFNELKLNRKDLSLVWQLISTTDSQLGGLHIAVIEVDQLHSKIKCTLFTVLCLPYGFSLESSHSFLWHLDMLVCLISFISTSSRQLLH